MTKQVRSQPAKKAPAKAKAPERTAVARRQKQNEAQRELAARWIAIGVSQQRAADHAGVDLRTVQRWSTEAAFADRVEELRALAFERIEPRVWANIELALENERRVLAGELKADDPVYAESRKLLDRFLDRAFYVEATPAAPGGNAAAAASVHVHVGDRGAEGAERGRRPVDVE